jgi:GT2 family glycosyltransferase
MAGSVAAKSASAVAGGHVTSEQSPESELAPDDLSMSDITVAVATVGRPASLRRCLEAILAGDVIPRELIVVDQGHDEATASVIAALRGAAPRVVHVKCRRLGLSASRNAAVASASMPIVAVTDDDCMPSGGWLQAVDDVLSPRTSSFAAVTGPLLPLEPEGERVWAVSTRDSNVRSDFAGLVAPWKVGTGGNFAIRREWLRRVGPYDERLGAGTRGRAGEDIDMLHRLLAAGARIRYEPRAVVYHERQDAFYRKSSRAAYGHGIGAYAAIRIREGDLRGVGMMGRWLWLRGHLLARQAVRGRVGGVWEELLVLAGTARGAAYGARVAPREPSKDS